MRSMWNGALFHSQRQKLRQSKKKISMLWIVTKFYSRFALVIATSIIIKFCSFIRSSYLKLIRWLVDLFSEGYFGIEEITFNCFVIKIEKYKDFFVRNITNFSYNKCLFEKQILAAFLKLTLNRKKVFYTK